MGLQQELMWESLCSMYYAHNREAEGRALNALELSLVDAFLDDQNSSTLTQTLERISEALKDAEVLLLWRDLDQSGVVIASTVSEELQMRWPLLGPLNRSVTPHPSVIFDAWKIPILKALPIVRSGSARSMVTRGWSRQGFTFILVAVHQRAGYFTRAEQNILDRGARVLRGRGAQHLEILTDLTRYDPNDTLDDLPETQVHSRGVPTRSLPNDDLSTSLTPHTRDQISALSVDSPMPILSAHDQNFDRHKRVNPNPACSLKMDSKSVKTTGLKPLEGSTSTLNVLSDRYQVLELLGQGGCGLVYRGFDPLIKRPVALKIFREHLLAGPDRDRLIEVFTREAAMAASINHPHIVTIYDLGFHGPDQLPFIVMELLDGVDLSDELKRSGPLELHRFIHLMIPTLDGLGRAHHNGLIHRDLKPSNFFMVSTERGEQVRIVDFGIAVALDDLDTQERSIAGTTRYFAPEYLRDRKISPQLDVYQMGVVMLELLTGQPAIEDRGAATLFDIIEGNLKFPPDFDRHPLSSMIRRATALDPAERYVDGDEMCKALIEVAQRLELSHLISPTM